MKQMIVFGSGGAALEYADLAIAIGYEVICFIDPYAKQGLIWGVPVLPSIPVTFELEEYVACIGIGDNSVRSRIYFELTGLYPSLNFPSLIHPSVPFGSGSVIGDGAIILAGGIIGPNVEIGKFCFIGNGACVSHECKLGDFSSVHLGASLSGDVVVGEGSALLMNICVSPGVSIGDYSIVGANSFLKSDISSLTVVCGSPAVIKKSRNMGDPYLR